MCNNDNSEKIQSKIKPEMEIEFGSRKLNTQNFSKTVVLPKDALVNCGCDMNNNDIVLDVRLVQENGQRYIKLTPVYKTEKGGEKTV